MGLVKKIVVHVYIAVTIDYEEWKVPEEYTKVLEPYMETIPTDFYLPWPSELKHEIGESIELFAMPFAFNTITIRSFENYYTAKEGVVRHIVAHEWDSQNFDLYALLCASEEGFLLSGRRTIKEVLDEAKLKSIN